MKKMSVLLDVFELCWTSVEAYRDKRRRTRAQERYKKLNEQVKKIETQLEKDIASK